MNIPAVPASHDQICLQRHSSLDPALRSIKVHRTARLHIAAVFSLIPAVLHTGVSPVPSAAGPAVPDMDSDITIRRCF